MNDTNDLTSNLNDEYVERDHIEPLYLEKAV